MCPYPKKKSQCALIEPAFPRKSQRFSLHQDEIWKPNLVLLGGGIGHVVLIVVLTAAADLEGYLNDRRLTLARTVAVDSQSVAEDLGQKIPASKLRHGHRSLLTSQRHRNIGTELWALLLMMMSLLPLLSFLFHE